MCWLEVRAVLITMSTESRPTIIMKAEPGTWTDVTADSSALALA